MKTAIKNRFCSSYIYEKLYPFKLKYMLHFMFELIIFYIHMFTLSTAFLHDGEILNNAYVILFDSYNSAGAKICYK